MSVGWTAALYSVRAYSTRTSSTQGLRVHSCYTLTIHCTKFASFKFNSLRFSREFSPALTPAHVLTASVEVDDGDGDYVPRATTMRLRGTSPPPPTSRRSSQSARLRTRGSLTPTREGNSPMAGPSQAPATDRDMMEVSEEGGEKAEPGTEPRKANQSDPAPNSGPESRSGSPIDTPPTEPKMPEVWLPAANAQPGSPLAAAAEPSASEDLALPERSILPRVRIPKNQRSARTSRGNTAPAVVLTQGGVTSRVALPPPFSSPAPSPKALDKEQPSADRQCPVSPTAGAGDASSGTPRSSAPAATTPSASGHAPSASAETAAPISRAAVSAASAQLPKVEPGRRREPHISSPRANQPAVESKPAVAPGGKAVNGPQSPKKGGAQDGAKSSVKSPRHCSGDAPQSKGTSIQLHRFSLDSEVKSAHTQT